MLDVIWNDLRCRKHAITLLAASTFLSMAMAPAQAGTTVTTYTYNPDGALTAVTEQTGVESSTTTYLTWDNFLPDADDPATGTIYTGNGNLLAIGPEPGKATKQFSFDERDRLASFQASDKASIYGYHADGLMASATADNGSGLGFYYAGSAMANLRQTDNDLWSARLGPVRYLDDGTQEILLAPRKDVAGVYDPDARTVTAYNYDDAFGAESDVPLADGYDLKDNPHRYAGEFRDPLWGGYYLKARWYDPDLATFLSRDPVPGFHPYNYGDGNPVMNIDPTGMSATSRHYFGDSGAGAVIFNVLVAPVIVVVTPQYWTDVYHNRHGELYFLLAGLASEALFFGLDTYSLSWAWRSARTFNRWSIQNTIDVALNAGQAAVASTHGGQFSLNTFGQNLEGLPAGLLLSRNFAGIGRRAHTLRGMDIVKRIEQLNDDTILVFRSRSSRGNPIKKHYSGWTSPVAEAKGLGYYHDNMILVSKKFRADNEIAILSNYVGEKKQYGVIRGHYTVSSIQPNSKLANSWFVRSQKSGLLGSYKEKKFQYVGQINIKHTSQSPFMIDFSEYKPNTLPNDQTEYGTVKNNCHDHQAALKSYLYNRGMY